MITLYAFMLTFVLGLIIGALALGYLCVHEYDKKQAEFLSTMPPPPPGYEAGPTTFYGPPLYHA